MLEDVLTVAAVVLALTQPVPQVVRVLRQRTIAGVSASTNWIGCAVNGAWIAYGVSQGLLPLVLLSGVYALGYVVVGVLLLSHGNRSGLAHGTTAALVAASIVVVAGWTVLGTVLALAVGVQFLPQVAEAWRSADLSGLAPGTYVVGAVDGLVWGGYGAVVGDLPLVLYGLVMGAVAALVLLPCWRWRRRVALAA